MHLYHLTLQAATDVSCLAYGNYSAPKSHEVVVAHGSVLDLLRVSATGQLSRILSVDTFSVIRSVLPVRLMGQTMDYLVVASDSGQLTILKYDSNEWKIECNETYGKSGVRRTVPGQYLAKDPLGRAILVSAVEKQKLVYQLNRDGASVLTISSPLEAHRSRAIVFDTVGLDNGLDNPLFCCLEVEYPEDDSSSEDAGGMASTLAPPPKLIVHYELDLGLNTVVRKWSRETDPGASSLLAIPGGTDGPGGVLVLCENWVLYESSSATSALRTPLPRRSDFPNERGLLLVAATLHKSRSGFFALLQSELGDLYKVTLGVDPLGGGAGQCTVTELTVKYFDTIPPASTMCITRNGYLFATGDGGSHGLYQFSGLGEASDAVAEARALNLDNLGGGETVEVFIPVFLPRSLTNLVKLEGYLGIHPLVESALLKDVGGGGASLLSLYGNGNSSATISLLKQGLPITEAASSPMQGSPTAVFTLKSPLTVGAPDPGPDTRIVLSFSNATVVLSVGETVEEMPSEATGFEPSAPTLSASLFPDGSYIQVHPGQMRVISHDAKGSKASSKAWTPPKTSSIVCAATNSRQVVLAFTGGNLQTFEYDATLRRPEDKEKLSLGGGVEVCAIAIPPVATGRQRAPFCVVADTGNMVRVLSLERDKGLEQVSSQALRSSATSLACVPTANPSVLQVFIGLTNGVLVRLTLDATSGVLSDPRPRFLGARPVKLSPVTLAGGRHGIISMSTRAFISQTSTGGLGGMQPLALPAGLELEAAASFSSDSLPEAFVAVSGRTLKIFSLGASTLSSTFHPSASFPCSYTPRHASLHPPSKLWVVVEAQHDALDEPGRKKSAASAAAANPRETAAAAAAAARGSLASGDGGTTTRWAATPPPVKDCGDSWACTLRLLDPSGKGGEEGIAVKCVYNFGGDETVLCSAMVSFSEGAGVAGGKEGEVYFVAGCAIGMQPCSRLAPGGCSLLTFRLHPPGSSGGAGMIVEGGSSGGAGEWSFELCHRTPIPALPSAMCAYNGRLLVGVGETLVQYELGKKQLLRKSEYRGLPSFATSLATSLDRVFVGTAVDSVVLLAYLATENKFAALAEDTVNRYVSCLTLLDYDSVAVGDKFGNMCVLRVPESLEKQGVIIGGVSTRPAAQSLGTTSSSTATAGATARLLWESGSGSLKKFSTVARFFVGGPLTSIFKGTLQENGPESLFYTTSAGAIGAFSPLTSKEDVDFFMHLEMYLRAQPKVSCVGRDHAAYRSYYFPVFVSESPPPSQSLKEFSHLRTHTRPICSKLLMEISAKPFFRSLTRFKSKCLETSPGPSTKFPKNWKSREYES